MSGEYMVSPRARRDLDQIYDHIAVRNHNPAAADRLLELLLDKFAVLATTPLVGQSCDFLRPGLRRLVVRKYVIYYSIDESMIWIERVVHGARDVEALFRDNGG